MIEAALELDVQMGMRIGGKECIFSDLDCSPKILKPLRFRMHSFLLSKTR